MALPNHRFRSSGAPRPIPQRRLTPAELSARLEKFYIAVVAFALGVGGTAVGFMFGVIPYWHTRSVGRYDGFFLTCCLVGAFAGFVVGVVNGARWYRAAEASPLVQRRMLTYLHRRGVDARGVPSRTLNAASLRSLLGQSRSRQP